MIRNAFRIIIRNTVTITNINLKSGSRTTRLFSREYYDVKESISIEEIENYKFPHPKWCMHVLTFSSEHGDHYEY